MANDIESSKPHKTKTRPKLAPVLLSRVDMGLLNSTALRLPFFATSVPPEQKTQEAAGPRVAADAAAEAMEAFPECQETGEFDWAPQLATLSDSHRNSHKPEGVDFARLVEGDIVELKTLNREYVLRYLGRGEAMLSGHPEICPQPTPALVYGSSWDGKNLKLGFLGSGLCLEFSTADHPFCRSSRIQWLRVRD